MPSSTESLSSGALSGGSKRATARALNRSPYRAMLLQSSAPHNATYWGGNKSDAGGPVQSTYHYVLTDKETGGGLDKYLAEIPFKFLTHHDYVITGYGSSSDIATRSMEGLAVLHARKLLEQGKYPELIRISRIYGQESREIQLDGKTSYKGMGTSFYELNNYLFAGKIIGGITFFGHGSIDGTALGTLVGNRGSLGFFYGYNSGDPTVPKFEGSFTDGASVNLYQCLGATFRDPRKGSDGIRFDQRYVPYSAGLESNPGVVRPIAARLAKSWIVPVVGYDWVGSVNNILDEFATSSFKGYAWGYSSVVEGNYDPQDRVGFLKNGEPDWQGNRVAAQLSLYSPDGKRTNANALFPDYLKLKLRDRGQLPTGMSLECLRGGSCSP